MWEINNALQLLNFFRSVILGIIFCVFYDFVTAVRRNGISTALKAIFHDLFYFAVCAPTLFCFLLATTNGELRGFVFIGIFIGFIITRFTLSPFIVKYLSALIRVILKLFGYLNATFYRLMAVICRIFSKISKNAQKVIKKLLKK